MIRYCVFFHKLPTVPTAPPETPSGSPITSTLITLRWDPIPLEHLNGILRFYLVDVVEVITNNSWTFHSVQNHVNIGPFHPYYTYRCRVAGFTVGVGPYTSFFYVNSGEACEFEALMGSVLRILGYCGNDYVKLC